MKFNDDITMAIAASARDVLEGKVKKEEVKYPHMMYHPETGAEGDKKKEFFDYVDANYEADKETD